VVSEPLNSIAMLNKRSTPREFQPSASVWHALVRVGMWRGRWGLQTCPRRQTSEGMPHDVSDPRASRLAPRARRRGISLLEVLISMFVMLFGLMGVAAIFPVGNHYAVKGEQFDRGSALAGTAFAELKSRGLMRPAVPNGTQFQGVWQFPDNKLVIGVNGQFNTAGYSGPVPPTLAYVIDPIGSAETNPTQNFGNFFPYDGGIDGQTNPWRSASLQTPWLNSAVWPIRRITVAGYDGLKLRPRVAEALCRLRDDLSVELPEEGDRPGIQRWATVDANNTPRIAYDDTPIARSYVGSYSWLATVLPVNDEARMGVQPGFQQLASYLYEVSVAVFYKRNMPPGPESERSLPAELHPGGELLMYLNGNDANDDLDAFDAAVEDIRPGQWLALAGVHPVSGKFLLKWYRILSMDVDTIDEDGGPYNAQRHVMLDGPDWPPPPTGQAAVMNLRAILLPGIVGVSTQTIQLERE
jgi:hypothetical protein